MPKYFRTNPSFRKKPKRKIKNIKFLFYILYKFHNLYFVYIVIFESFVYFIYFVYWFPAGALPELWWWFRPSSSKEEVSTIRGNAQRVAAWAMMQSAARRSLGVGCLHRRFPSADCAVVVLTGLA